MDIDKAFPHVGHRLTVVTYGNPVQNVAVECLDCYEVISDADTDDVRREKEIAAYKAQLRESGRRWQAQFGR